MRRKKKIAEGNGGIDYQDCWNMDLRLAEIIRTNLQAFLQAEKAGPQGYPGVLDFEPGNDKGYSEWVKIIGSSGHRLFVILYSSVRNSSTLPSSLRQSGKVRMRLPG